MSAEDIERIADMIDEARPHVQIEWTMGGTRTTTGPRTSARTRWRASVRGSQSCLPNATARGHANYGLRRRLRESTLSAVLRSVTGWWSWWAVIWAGRPRPAASRRFQIVQLVRADVAGEVRR